MERWMEGRRGRWTEGGFWREMWSRLIQPCLLSPWRSFTILKIIARSLLASWLLAVSLFFFFSPFHMWWEQCPAPIQPPSTSHCVSPPTHQSPPPLQCSQCWHRQIARLGRDNHHYSSWCEEGEVEGGRGRMRSCYVVMEKNQGSEEQHRYEGSLAVMTYLFFSQMALSVFGHAPPAPF